MSRERIKPIHFGLGVVALPYINPTHEMLLTISNGENHRKRERALVRGMSKYLETFSGDGVREFPGGAVEAHYFWKTFSVGTACLNAMVDEIDQELQYQMVEPDQLTPSGKSFLVFQDRITKYVLFLVKPYHWIVDDAQRQIIMQKNKTILVSPRLYDLRMLEGSLKVRPRDRVIANRFVNEYLARNTS